MPDQFFHEMPLKLLKSLIATFESKFLANESGVLQYLQANWLFPSIY